VVIRVIARLHVGKLVQHRRVQRESQGQTSTAFQTHRVCFLSNTHFAFSVILDNYQMCSTTRHFNKIEIAQQLKYNNRCLTEHWAARSFKDASWNGCYVATTTLSLTLSRTTWKSDLRQAPVAAETFKLAKVEESSCT